MLLIVIRSSAFTLFLILFITVLVKLGGRLTVVTMPDALINVTFFVFVFLPEKNSRLQFPELII